MEKKKPNDEIGPPKIGNTYFIEIGKITTKTRESLDIIEPVVDALRGLTLSIKVNDVDIELELK